MSTTAQKVEIVKKYTKKFKRFHSDRYKRVDASWRAPRGIDNRMRRRYRGTAPIPGIGYGSDKRTKYMLPCGYRKITVRNVNDLEPLLMNTNEYCAEINRAVGVLKRKAIVDRCKELGIKVINGTARMEVMDKE